jgi:catechol 2,3-dioxygenase-like lactoylglutathione lyase family enzyme
MIGNGNVTVYVSDMDAAIRFYTESLGLELTNRFGKQWATIYAGPSYWTTDEVGAGLIIGLHPKSRKAAAPGTVGSIGFGLETYEPLERVIAELEPRGVRFTSEIVRFEAGNSVGFADPDGLKTFVHEFPPFMVPESDLQAAEGSASGDAAAELLTGGHAIVYVSNMDAAVQFYSDLLGLKLTNRYGDQWATVEAGELVVGLHPQTVHTPKPGTKGSVVLGLVVDGEIDRVVARLAERGVRTTGKLVRTAASGFVEIADQDGNAIYLWEPVVAAAPKRRSAAR